MAAYMAQKWRQTIGMAQGNWVKVWGGPISQHGPDCLKFISSFKLGLYLGPRALYFETQLWTQTLQNGGPIILINWVETQIGSGPNVKPPLTPKGPRGVFLQKRSKSAISSSRSANEFFFTFFHFFSLLTVGSCTRLLGEHVQKVSRHLIARIVRL
jgi:hypothetical protein